MPTKIRSRSCPAEEVDKTRHSLVVGIVNRLLSGLRSRALKSIELSRGVGLRRPMGIVSCGSGLRSLHDQKFRA